MNNIAVKVFKVLDIKNETEDALKNALDVESMFALADLYEEMGKNHHIVRFHRLVAQWAQLLLPIWIRMAADASIGVSRTDSMEAVQVTTRRTQKRLYISVRTYIHVRTPSYRGIDLRIHPLDLQWTDEPHVQQWSKIKSKLHSIANFHQNYGPGES